MDDLFIEALDLLKTAESACVTTIDECGRPDSRAMFNLRNANQFPRLIPFFSARVEGYETWFTTNTSSRKVAQLAANPAASAYYCRPGEWRGLMLGGDLQVVTELEAKAALWQDGWELYYPRGPVDPDYAVLRFRPTLVKYYSRLRTVVLEGAA